MKICVVLVILALSIGIGWGQANATEDMGCKALVKSNAIEFSFPVPNKEIFEWCQDKTTDNYLEYVWQVALEGVEPKYNYQFGIYLFKFPGSKQRKGDLKKLISQAQVSVWELKTGSVRQDMKIQAVIKSDRLIIRVTDKATISALMANKPTIAHFNVYTPYKELNLVTSTTLVVEG